MLSGTAEQLVIQPIEATSASAVVPIEIFACPSNEPNSTDGGDGGDECSDYGSGEGRDGLGSLLSPVLSSFSSSQDGFLDGSTIAAVPRLRSQSAFSPSSPLLSRAASGSSSLEDGNGNRGSNSGGGGRQRVSSVATIEGSGGMAAAAASAGLGGLGALVVLRDGVLEKHGLAAGVSDSLFLFLF